MTGVDRAPADPCGCGHVRNQHDRYGDGRCLAAGCGCQRLAPTTTEEDP